MVLMDRMSGVGYIVTKVLDHAHEVKRMCFELARMYQELNYREMVATLENYYGFLPTHRYEDPSITMEEYAPKCLLASLIAERIVLRMRNLWKHVTIAIVGVGGSGKTSYAVAGMIGALMLIGYDYQTAISYVSNLVFFNPKRFVDFTKELVENRKWAPVILLDDVGAQISKYWMHLGEMYWVYLFSVLDQLKDWCGALIMTARNFNAIPSRMREIVDIVIHATEAEIDGFIVDLMKVYRRDEYERRRTRRPIMIDAYIPTLKMPNKIWMNMVESRRELGRRRLSFVSEILELQPKIEEQKIEKLREKVGKDEHRGETKT